MEILFEDSDVLVVDKPAGLLVHPDGKHAEATLVDWILKNRPEMRGVGERMQKNGVSIERPGVVHRLDRETSGVLVLAKTTAAFSFLKGQFQNRSVKKEYHAFLWGFLKTPEVVVEAPIGRSGREPPRRLAGRGPRGNAREAQTRFQTVHQFESEGATFSFVKAFPLTGRTHQIRAHALYLQRPIVADTLYAPGKPLALGFSRLALHARAVSLMLPGGIEKTFEAPYPEDFSRAIAKYLPA